MRDGAFLSTSKYEQKFLFKSVLFVLSLTLCCSPGSHDGQTANIRATLSYDERRISRRLVSPCLLSLTFALASALCHSDTLRSGYQPSKGNAYGGGGYGAAGFQQSHFW